MLRSAITLSMLTGRPVVVDRVRGRRTPPGLRPQHVQAVRASARVSGARVEGAGVGSRRVSFNPGPVRGGGDCFDIGTAGAASLVLQTLSLALVCRADVPSEVTVRGGTHVPFSPCFEFLQWSWRPCLRRLGVALELTLGRPGFYPRGGGWLRARLIPARRLRPLILCERGALRRVTGVSAVAGLDRAIAARQHGAARDRLGARGVDCAIEEQGWHAGSPGSVLALYGVFEAAEAGFFALGVRGKPAERVGREAADQLLDFLDGAAAVQAHLADQLLLPLALARGPSVLRTERVTSHLLTNAAVVRRFLPVGIDIPAPETVPAEVRIEPRSPG